MVYLQEIGEIGGAVCPECNRSFGSEMALKVHFSIMHKSPETKDIQAIACGSCGQVFDNYHKFKIHAGLAHDPLSVNNFRRRVQEAQSKPQPKSITVLPIDAKKFYPSNVPKYVEQGAELSVLEAHWSTCVPLLFVGPKGVGKTLSVAKFAESKGSPIIQFDCSEDTKRWDLLGRFVDIGTFELGVLPAAFEVANSEGRCILVFEELNALSPNMQKVLNQLLDWRRHVYVPELNRVYTLQSNSKLMVVATMNPSTYGGTFELNEDLRSRFAEYVVTYPNDDVERKVVRLYDGVPDNVLNGLLTFAKESRSGQVSYAVSPRDLTLFAQVYSAYSKVFGDRALVYALRTTIVNRYTEEEVKTWVKPRLVSIFGADVVSNL